MRIGVAVFSFLSCTSAVAADCDGLAKLKLKDVKIATAQALPAGEFKPPEGAAVRSLPAFCRVAGSIHPSGDSDIQFEVWLPASGWNAKFHGVGNGGFAGSINYGAMGATLRRGYATASTDTGHHAAAGTDASWALHHPEKIVDFGHRAIHETAVTAKAVIKAYYGDGPKRSYFNSCSNGGRQALMEAQRYPGDYDGIVAGAPANYWTHLLTAAIWDMVATTKDPASYIPPSKLPAITAAAQAACDGKDGVRDGVIENPANCPFDPTPLLCKGADSDSCLTQPQLTALQKIYGGPKTSQGKQVNPGFSPGAESGAGGWNSWITGTEPTKSLQFGFGTNFFKHMVYSDPAWDYRQFDVDRDSKAADKLAPILSAENPDLKSFHARGGKLLLYHGWSDAAIPAMATVSYYQKVLEKVGPKEAASFVQLFMVPGMQHCGGGDGPSVFGQLGPDENDAEHSIDRALERWVEEGVAPAHIIATKYKANNPASGVALTRPLCPYPQVAKWKGSGSTDDASNFTCTQP